MKIIDVNSWKRKAHYENFIGYDYPAFSLSARLDVTELVNRHKTVGTAFFTDFIYLATKSLNSIEEFRIRLNDGQVVLYDKISPSYIIMSDDDVIVTVRTEFDDDYKKFYAAARADTERERKCGKRQSFNNSSSPDVYYFTCVPWLDFVSMTNPYDFKNLSQSSIPRCSLGKYVLENGRYKMSFDIAAHHALFDGEPLARGFNEIQKALDNTEALLK